MKKTDWWQITSAIYFPLQYLLVHVFLFGFTFEPVELAPKVVTAFHWDEIVLAVWNFRNLFLAGLTVSSVFMLIIYAIPYALILLWSAKYVIVYIFVLYQLVGYCVIKYRSYLHEKHITLNNVVVVKIGSPGCGKSSSGLYEAVIMARKMWSDLQWQYYKCNRNLAKWRKQNNIEKLREYDEIKYSYEFFKKSGSVPCLLSNIPVQVDGKYTTFVSKEHCEQKERLPAHCVLFLDEVGAMLTVDTAKQRMGDDADEYQNAINVSDFFRLCRHFGNWRIICTEQDSENIYIDVRRVVSKNEYMLWQRWVLKPYIFLALFYPLRAIAVRFQKTSRIFVPFLMFLEKLCKSIGFRKYRYLTENNTQRHTGMQKGKRTFYLPSLLNFKYDERTFRNFYKCKDQTITPHVFDNLILDDTDTYKKMFLRSEKKRKK